MLESTIAALASPPGIGGISIIRLSGPNSIPIAARIFRPHGKPSGSPLPHRLTYGHIVDPADGHTIDEVLLAIMPAPRSYTREDVVEIQSHGSPAAIHAILKLVIQSGATPAPPGEFTRRAFLNGRIDLTQAEAVMDLIEARSEMALARFAALADGSLRRDIAALREACLAMLGRIEAEIEFPDEIEETGDGSQLVRQLRERLADPLRRLSDSFEAGRLMREGLNVTLVGRPNVGKSSLMNRLLGRDRSIVTPYPGTTRDAIDACIQLDGLPVTLWDTAGLHRTQDPVEAVGISRALERAAAAELILLVMEAERPFAERDRHVLSELQGRPTVYVINKIDLLPQGMITLPPADWPAGSIVPVSARTGEGISALENAIRERVQGDLDFESSSAVVNLRQRNWLLAGGNAVDRAIESVAGGLTSEALAVHLRDCLAALDAVTGETAGSDVLEHIFGRFCIGK
jgi:tRNA modification GTPase